MELGTTHYLVRVQSTMERLVICQALLTRRDIVTESQEALQVHLRWVTYITSTPQDFPDNVPAVVTRTDLP